MMIDAALVGTSVTAVLIWKETANRTYVKYEINRYKNFRTWVEEAAKAAGK